MSFDLNFFNQSVREKLSKHKPSLPVWALAFASLIFLVGVAYSLYLKPPAEFPVKMIFTVRERAGLNEIAATLERQKVIRSPFWFRAAVILTGGERGAMAGDYFFSKPLNVLTIASRMTSGNFGLTPVRLTFPEGMTTAQMGTILEDQLVNFDGAQFMKLAKPLEGRLFPDTYFFAPNAKAPDVVATLRANFDRKFESIAGEVQAFGKPEKDIVIMASVLEAEARTTETRRTIAGILWKRLSLGMPLQVDAPFQYIIGKNTFQLTLDDLKYDSPYNTYLYKGLPPGAIGNAGLDSLLAAVTPIKSPYFFYLSDVRGNMHYAKTFDEHVTNKEKYLR